MEGKLIIFLACCTCFSSVLASEQLHGGRLSFNDGATNMNTNVALVASKEALGGLSSESQQNLAVVDPSGALDAVAKSAVESDIQEDPNDRFITTRSGKRRPMLMETESEWADEELMGSFRQSAPKRGKVLLRKRRCGGGGGGDDDDGGNARRARRTRRIRARRARRAKATRRAAKSSTTTVTRKVIQNGQVVSQTTETQKAGQLPSQAIVREQPATVVRTIQQPQPVIVHQQQQQPPIAAQQPQTAAAVPSISINGSVKVN